MRLTTGFVTFVLATSFGSVGGTEQYTDVSDDGRRTVTYPAPTEGGHAFVTSSFAPYALTPSWTAGLERAVGGLDFGDYDGDDDIDLAVGCYDASNSFPPIPEHETFIYRNDGGTLQLMPSWTSVDERHTADVRFGDEDGDGRPDLFVSNGGTSLDASVVYRNGPTGMDETPDWIAGDATFSLGAVLGDINADGHLDAVVANQGSPANPIRPASVFFGTGSGLETTPSWTSADSTISNSAGLLDLDGSSVTQITGHTFAADGFTRIFYLPHEALLSVDRIAIVGVIQLNFSTVDLRQGRLQFALPVSPGATIEVDYTYAQTPDLAFTRWVNFETCIYSNPAGTPDATPSWTTGSTQDDKGVAIADFDQDGDADLAFGGGEPTVIYRNDGGTLNGPVFSSINPFHGCQDLDWADVDNDGDLDLATVHFSNRQVRLYLNQGGVIDPVPCWVYTHGTSATEVAFGDVNGDGFLDLAAGSSRSPVVLFLNQGPPVSTPEGPGGADPTTATAHVRAFPNPFRESVQLRSTAGELTRWVRVFDVTGRSVRRLSLTAGATDWDGRDERGELVPAGVYWVQPEGSEQPARRVVHVR